MNVSIDYSELTFLEVIGNSGNVHKAKWRDQDVIVKTCWGLGTTERELRHMKSLCHQNIVFVHGIAEDDDKLYVVMEYMDGGSLEILLHSENKPTYFFAHVLHWAYQIALALAYMHEQKPKAVIHRNINPKSIHLTNHRRDLKIFDFTYARNVSITQTRNVGTGRYKSPEIFLAEKHTEKSDVYSWAITLWEMLSGKRPFENISESELGQKVINNERPSLDDLMDDVPNEIKTLMTDCWDSDPAKRKTMNEVLAVLQKYYDLLEPEQLRLPIQQMQ